MSPNALRYDAAKIIIFFNKIQLNLTTRKRASIYSADIQSITLILYLNDSTLCDIFLRKLCAESNWLKNNDSRTSLLLHT